MNVNNYDRHSGAKGWLVGWLDSDDSGDIHYDEFAEQLNRMKADDSHTLLVFISTMCRSS